MITRVLAGVVLMGMLFSKVFPQESEVKISNIKTTGIGESWLSDIIKEWEN